MKIPSDLPSYRRSRNKWGRAVKTLIFSLFLIALVGGGGWYAYKQFLTPADNREVLTAKVIKGDLVVTVTDRGEMEAVNSIQVACELEGGGKLVSIVPEGTRVKKNDEVGRIDTDLLQKAKSEQEVKVEMAVGKLQAAESELEVQLNKAESEIATKKLVYDLADIDFRNYLTGEYKVESEGQKGSLELARKELKESEDDLEYTRNLVRKGFGQMEQVRVKELSVLNKRFAVDQNLAKLNLLETVTKQRKMLELEAKFQDSKRDLERTKKSMSATTEKAKGDKSAAQKTLSIEKKTLERIDDQLLRCVIRAPQDGIVIYYRRGWWDDESRIRPGVTLNSQQVIFTLPDLSQMRVKLKVHESVVKRVSKDLPCRMQIEALPGVILTGKVTNVGSVAQSDGFRGGGVKEYSVESSIDDIPTDAGLKPGMTAEVKIVLKTIRDVQLVPIQSVTEVDGKNIVYVVTPAGVTRRDVELGDRNDINVQILTGLTEGEFVALDARLRAAAEIKAQGNTPGTKPTAFVSDKTPSAGSP